MPCVALLTAVQVSQSLSGILISSTERQFVQTADGNFYSLKKLFVVESDDLEDIDSSTQHSQTSSTLVESSAASLENKTVSASPSELVHAVCIVCRTLPVTRAFLPCRHACVCGLCFQQLSCCPMCRGVIQSYFKIQDEPFADTAESDASSELKRMTAGEILRGIFLPS
ncbi:PREDICTED: cell growth regulator with RING finger domain protein 1-like [Acropora digitifera]|uniref:cell growth regulator with RING finger domain protein 1-like n=1 Tax=Acropora digitifera TaxID=70779 RepID=UPI00077A1FEA|nr:PREDICTED: cell growth regulator with RING finger domain protein 1-like [Acropora digitifera]